MGEAPTTVARVPTTPQVWIARGLVVTSAALFCVGVFSPCFTVEAGIGRNSVGEVLAKLSGTDQARTWTLIGGINAVWSEGDRILGAFLFVFTILWPVFKTAVLLLLARAQPLVGRPRRLLHAVSAFGKLSMADVFVIALVVVAVKGLPGGVEVTMEWGAHVFALSVIVSLAASLHVEDMHGLRD